MSELPTKQTLGSLLAPFARQAEEDLDRWIVEDDSPQALAEAMRYSVLGGGKRMRPALVFLSCQAVGGAIDEMTRRAAVAVELVHCYSLVHDDLPAMDNDTLRRGRPTAHVRFGQAMAILAGDALLTRAFAVLTEAMDDRGGALAAELARGAGPSGMIAGQVADMDLCQVPPAGEGLRFIHLRKTAALIRAAARMGAVCGRAAPNDLDAISRASEALGLAFQVVDDVLDVTGDAARLGKTPGKDADTGKRTYVAELGLERSVELCHELTRASLDALAGLGPKAQPMRDLATLLAQRTH